MTIEDKPACYKIELKKENEKGVALAGAEFTLYEDQACQKEIDRVLTDGNGIAMFENLEVKKKILNMKSVWKVIRKRESVCWL